MHIKINSWNKYNPRNDTKTKLWFAFSNRAVEDESFFHFNGEEFKTFIYILSKASQKNQDNIILVPEHASRTCGIPAEFVHSAIQKLLELKIISEFNPDESVQIRTESVQVCTDHEQTCEKPVQNRHATGQDRGVQDSTRQDIGGEDSTDSPPPPPDGGNVLDVLNTDLLRDVLCSVPLSIQGHWILEFKDIEWIKRVLTKAILKKTSSGKKVTERDWGFVLTSWLISEKERPNISKASTEWTPPSQISSAEAHAAVDDLLARLKVKSLSEAFFAKSKGGSNVQ